MRYVLYMQRCSRFYSNFIEEYVHFVQIVRINRLLHLQIHERFDIYFYLLLCCTLSLALSLSLTHTSICYGVWHHSSHFSSIRLFIDCYTASTGDKVVSELALYYGWHQVLQLVAFFDSVETKSMYNSYSDKIWISSRKYTATYIELFQLNGTNNSKNMIDLRTTSQIEVNVIWKSEHLV